MSDPSTLREELIEARANRDRLAHQVAALRQRVAEVEAARDVMAQRVEDAEAALGYVQHDHDARGERLWRMATKAGHEPWSEDNDATAEWSISTALDQRAAQAQVIKQATNIALSVWSNTCNAQCSEEDRTHTPECLLAASLHAALAAAPTPTAEAEGCSECETTGRNCIVHSTPPTTDAEEATEA